MSRLSIDELKKIFKLSPLPKEGGFYFQTWKSNSGTSIYYLITPETWSSFHVLSVNEVWHFYMGDPLKQLQLFPDGRAELYQFGNDFKNGYRPQLVCTSGVWQSTRLEEGGSWALVGTTTTPPYTDTSIRYPVENELEEIFPDYIDLIRKFK